jgi:O-antigen biosynthesis protein
MKKKPINQNGFTLNERLGLFIHEDGPEIDYADSSEDYLLNLFLSKNHMNSYPVEMQRHIKDWPTRYHLSHMRTNLLESVKGLFSPDSKVLELGAGMGALTLWLCDHFRHVDAIEGSLKRAQALRARAKDRNNLRVFVGDISNIKFTEKYDLITLVGVLEYLPFYSQGDSRTICMDFFNRLIGCLNKEGILLIGIENKLGAKYFSGCHEDHTGKLFSGIMDYPGKSPVTFSRNEIERILHEAGMTKVQFYHLFPDYKLPKLVFREMQDDDYSMVRGWFKGYFEDLSRERLYFFHDSLFIETLINSRLLHHFSNSFLIVSSVSDKTNLDTDFLIKKFWNPEDTKPVFHHTISLLRDDSEYRIERSPLNGGALETRVDKTDFKLSESEKYIEGKPLMTEVYKSLFINDSFSSLVDILNEIKDGLLKSFSKDIRDDFGYEVVDGRSIDYCFWNLLRRNDGQLIFIDTKWAYDGFLTVDDVLYRNLNGLYYDVRYHVKQIPFSEFTISLLSKVYENYDLERFFKNIRVDLDFSNPIALFPKNIEDYLSRDKIDYVRIRPDEIIQIQGKLSGRAWKLLGKYYSLRDYLRKAIWRNS